MYVCTGLKRVIIHDCLEVNPFPELGVGLAPLSKPTGRDQKGRGTSAAANAARALCEARSLHPVKPIPAFIHHITTTIVIAISIAISPAT